MTKETAEPATAMSLIGGEEKDTLDYPANWIDATLLHDDRSLDGPQLKADIVRHFNHTLGQEIRTAMAHPVYQSVALAIKDRVTEQWKATQQRYADQDVRKTCYLSLEYLMGRALGNALLNLDLVNMTAGSLDELGMSLGDIEQLEADAGLGNGGLGRLAACFLDSCATLSLPVMGYGIRYRYGMFHQRIVNGYQVEEPDNWLRQSNIWEVARPELAQRIKFRGHTIAIDHEPGIGNGSRKHAWVEADEVLAVPYDVPIPGYRNKTVNTLRLWSAQATDEFNLAEFNAGSYTAAVAQKNAAENITMVLYPNDSSENGKFLRLEQQYFLVSASLQDTLRIWCEQNDSFDEFAAKHCFQLNDTHPTLAIPELMRLLIDEHQLSWDEAWEIATTTMAYTNHTLLPEALETWSVMMISQLIPRIWEIIQEINTRFVAEVAQRWPGQPELHQRMAIVEEGDFPNVRMAHLAIVGSFSVNGVARLHSMLLQQGLFNDFYQLWPQRFNNKTNGVTQRRWLAHCNPALGELITSVIGDGWVTDLTQLEQLVPYADDAGFQQRWSAVKRLNKLRLAELVADRCGIEFNQDALFDVQVKRMHEYKRQLMNALHAIHLYQRVLAGDDINPRCILIAGKAAPGYEMAKAIVKMINNIAQVINNDPATAGKLRMVFLPDYNVSAMEIICPAADLSEQISTAGKEASGTGNMKFMMNGALTIGTLDGANVEIREAVGEENFFLFGMNETEVAELRGHYDPAGIIEQNPDLQAIMMSLSDGSFNAGEPGIFDSILQALYSPHDQWMTIADLPSFIAAQQQVDASYRDQQDWLRKSILNVATSGRFSTDRTMQDYNADIWQLVPCPS